MEMKLLSSRKSAENEILGLEGESIDLGVVGTASRAILFQVIFGFKENEKAKVSEVGLSVLTKKHKTDL